MKNRSLVLLLIVVLGLLPGCFWGGPEPEEVGGSEDPADAWYNSTALKWWFGDHGEGMPEVIASPEKLAKLGARGKYLTEGVAACGSCHGIANEKGSIANEKGSIADEKGSGEGSLSSRSGPLAGGAILKDRFGEVRAANITPDVKTGIGRWSIGDVVRALRSSIDNEGRPLSIEAHLGYQWAADKDLKAIAVHLLSQEPVVNEVSRRNLGGIERNRFGIFPQHRDRDGYVPTMPSQRGPVYGRYLADNVARCGICHSPDGVFSAERYSGGSRRRGSRLIASIKSLVSNTFSFDGKEESEIPSDTLALMSPTARKKFADSALDGDELEVVEQGQSNGAEEAEVSLGYFPPVAPDIRGTADSGLGAWSTEDIVNYLSTGKGLGGKAPKRGDSGESNCPLEFFASMKNEDKLSIANFLKSL